jgi:TetR/AcrR family transcriptional regulator
MRSALEEFASSGYAGARTATIARRAGVNKQLIFHYFGSKAGLYRAVLDGVSERLTAARRRSLPSGSSSTDRLRHGIRTLVNVLVSDPTLPPLLARGAMESGSQGEPAREAVRGVVAEIANEISRGQGLGYFRDDIEPRDIAAEAVVLILGTLTFGSLMTEGGVSGKAPDGGWVGHLSERLIRSLTW